MTTTVLAPLLRQAFLNNNGQPLAGGQLFSYQAGTTTPLATYTDSTGVTSNANPIILNARGECNCWVPPNTAYKFVLEDSFGNTIWSVDQVVNSQLLTLYGGVDTGSVNAYVINFTANFSVLTDGIILAWIAANTNTSASTLNVNGLGVVNILNQDGSALRAGEITADQVVQVMYKGGNWLLLAGSVASGVLAVPGSASAPSIAFAADPGTGFYQSASGEIDISLSGAAAGTLITGKAGTFTATITGGSGASPTISYWIVEKLCILRGGSALIASSATTMTMTGLPAAVTPQSGASSIPCLLQDNGATAGGWAQVNSGTGTITFGLGFNNNQSGFTNSGNKGLGAGWSIAYSLG